MAEIITAINTQKVSQRVKEGVERTKKKIEAAFDEIKHEPFTLKMITEKAGVYRTVLDRSLSYAHLKKKITSHPNYQKTLRKEKK